MWDEADFLELLKDAKDDTGTDLLPLRLQVPIVLFIITFLGGILPLTLRTRFNEPRLRALASTTRNVFMHCLICASSGMLLATICLTLLPTARAYFHNESGRGYPNAELCAGFGFLAVFFLQEIVFLRFGNTDIDYIDQWHLYLVQFIRCELNVLKNYLPPPKEPTYADEIEMDDLSQLGLKREELETLYAELQAERPTRRTLRTAYLRELREHRRITHPKLNCTVKLGVITLCIHSICDGFGLGSQPTSGQTFHMLWCLGIQRIIIGMATCAELMVSNFSFKAIVYVLTVYSVMPAIGSLIATASAHFGASRGALAVFNAYSAGSLLYVIFFELFKGNKHEALFGFGQFLATFSGYSCSVLLSMIIIDYSLL